VQHVGGEITEEFAIGDFERSPTLIFVPVFIQKKNKGRNKKELYQF